jgi:phage shock protein PspC (stress-responsive transcriptional regulator)
MTVTAEPGLAGLQARTQAELAPRLMAQLQRLNWDAERLAAHQAERLARYFVVDVMIVRIAFVVLTVFSGAGIPLYLAGLLLIPEEGSNQSIAGSLIESVRSRPRQSAAGSR